MSNDPSDDPTFRAPVLDPVLFAPSTIISSRTRSVFLIMFKIGGGRSRSRWSRSAGATLHLAVLHAVGLGGEMADRFDKAKVAQRLKFAEICRRRASRSAVSPCNRCRCCSSRSCLFGAFPRCSGRSNTASCPIICTERTARRQRADRGRARSSRSCSAPSSAALRRKRRRQSRPFRLPDDGIAAACWVAEPVHPANRRGRARPRRSRSNIFSLDRPI